MTTIAKSENTGLPTGILYGLLAALIWGAWPVVSRLGVQQSLTAADITALRFGVAGLLLLPLVLKHGLAGRPPLAALVLAAGAGAPYVLLAVGGLSYAPAGHAGVIVPSCMMGFTALGSWLVLKDRPTKARLLGLAVILAGISTIGLGNLGAAGGDAWKGHLLFVAAGFCWAVYTVASKAWSVEPLQATALVSVISMLLYLPAYLVFGDPRLASAPLDEIVFQGISQGLFAAILALLCYTRAVALLGASRGAIFAALVPAVALVLAYPVLGEVPNNVELVGVAVVVLGMLQALGLLKGPHTAG